MWTLRWVLLGLGALLIVGIYLWGRSVMRRPGSSDRSRIEPPALDDLLVDSSQEPDADPDTAVPAQEHAPGSTNETQHVVTVRLVPKAQELNGQTVVLALRAAGLRHGRYGIFHCMPGSGPDEPLFSVANLTEPGSFDLTNIAQTTIPGMSFFLVLPGVGDPVQRFDMMVDTARSLALELDAELHDDRGSSWSIQRERYVREELIQYRHQLERS